MLRNIELRKLPADTLCQVVDILEINDDWKRFMSIIPETLQTETTKRKYNNTHIRLIEEHAKIYGQKHTEILLEEWGTSGRVRPTLTHLKEILTRAAMYRAADEIAIMLGDSLPERPTHGPAAPITTNITELLNDDGIEHRLNNMSSINKDKFNEICNKTTKQMKSASDIILFSKSKTEEKNIYDKTTLQMKSDGDLMQFSKDESTFLGSFNVPRLTDMISSDVDQKPSDSKYSGKSESEDSNKNLYSYQTSFPAINISLGIESAILKDTNLIHFEYNELKTITNNFSENLSNDGLKGRIGFGGFGDVFVGKHSKYGLLAVKKAHSRSQVHHNKPDIDMKLFNAEVKYLSEFRHINIVPIIGFSKDGPVPCIVCEYITGGSLRQNIKAKILNEARRIKIMVGTAEGLKYLHTTEKTVKIKSSQISGVESDSQNARKNFVHGDVTSANILLTKDFVPKLCDFGLAKQFDTTFVTTCAIGTSAYMAPEGFHGTITQKIDIYSFGIVLLELLTGLNIIVETNGEHVNIKDFVEENSVDNDISHLIDPVVNPWTQASEIYSLAQKCLERDRRDRPIITEVANILYRIQNDS